MSTSDLLTLRLSNQYLIGASTTSTADVIKHLGAMQSQDYYGAIWAIAQRMKGEYNESQLESAFNKGNFLRTHVLRPTWHFVHPENIRWMIRLSAPRVKRFVAYYNNKLDLDAVLFQKTNQIIVESLANNTYLTRDELMERLRTRGIEPGNTQRRAHIIFEAELDELICSGPRIGKQFTYALMSERAPHALELTKEEALMRLTKTYFQSHGPATMSDFSWWSGLTMGDVKKGIAMNREIVKEDIDGITYWRFPDEISSVNERVYLLPNYDEYGIAYKERSAFFNPLYLKLLNSRGNATFQHLIMRKGHFIGTWKRTLKADTVVIESIFFKKPTSEERDQFLLATDQYGKFLAKQVKLVW